MRMLFPPQVSGRFINELTSDMNALVDSLFGEQHEGAPRSVATFTPRMDVVETEQAFQLILDLPGVNPDDIEIKVEEDAVTIHGQRKHAWAEQKDGTHRRVERAFGDFRRTLTLPKSVNKDAVEADYTDGVLIVNVPKAVPVEARKVTIQRGSSKDVSTGSDASTSPSEMCDQ